MGNVLGVGGVSIDLLGMVAALPNWNEIEYISDHQKQQGGMIATALATVAKLRGQAEFIGGIGDDELGTYALQVFRENGVQMISARIIEILTFGNSSNSLIV